MKLLVTSRDVGSALHIIEIVKYIKLIGKDEVCIYAQEPAFSFFQKNGLISNLIDAVPSRNSKNQDQEWLNLCLEIINTVIPDFILSGYSTARDSGIDEYIIYSAHGKIPTSVMQDSWGDINSAYGSKADYYFCIDSLSADLIASRYQVKSFALGAPKYFKYSTIDFTNRRKNNRIALKLDEKKPVIGYFGQALHNLKGYEDTVKSLIQTFKKISTNAINIAYRPHPRESISDANCTKKWFEEQDINPIFLKDITPEDAFSMCDVICSPFSNCSYDASYINYFSKTPFVVPINLLFNSEIHIYCENVAHIDTTPYVKLGLALHVNKKEVLETVLDFAMSSEGRDQVWKASKQLMDPTKASEKIVNFIHEKITQKV